ncbi:MAG: hypothetical protein EOL87_12715 [Spartobacteria bacterium]|nr:hypothetical protein [Spartobacteria bacterium]
MNTARIRCLSDELARHACLLFVGMTVSNVLSFLFQMLVSRALPSEEYALFVAALSVIMIVQRPLTAFTTALSHYSSLLAMAGRLGDVRRLLRKWLLIMGLVAVFASVLVIIFHVAIASYMHVDRMDSVWLFAAVIPALFLGAVLDGVGQGVQLFLWCVVSGVVGVVVRVVFGAGLVWFIFPVCGLAMLGYGLGLYAAVTVLFAGLMRKFKTESSGKSDVPSIRYCLLQSFVFQVAYAILMMADVVLVNHYIPDDHVFSYAATFGRMIVLLPGSIVIAMFPKVASDGRGTREQRQVFIRSFQWTALFVILAIVAGLACSDLLTRILFGIKHPSPHLKNLLAVLSCAMGASALLNLSMQYFLAQRRFKELTPQILCSAGFLLFVHRYHAVSMQIAVASLFFNTLALLLLLVFNKKKVRRWLTKATTVRFCKYADLPTSGSRLCSPVISASAGFMFNE